MSRLTLSDTKQRAPNHIVNVSFITFNGSVQLHNIYIIIYDVNIRCVILITATGYLIDIVTESERLTG